MTSLSSIHRNIINSLPSTSQAKQYLWKHRKKISLAGAAAASTIALYYYFKSDSPPPPSPSGSSSSRGLVTSSSSEAGNDRVIRARALGRQEASSNGSTPPSSLSSSSASSTLGSSDSRSGNAVRPPVTRANSATTLEEGKSEAPSPNTSRKSLLAPEAKNSGKGNRGGRGRALDRRGSSKSRRTSRSRSPERSPSLSSGETKSATVSDEHLDAKSSRFKGAADESKVQVSTSPSLSAVVDAQADAKEIRTTPRENEVMSSPSESKALQSPDSKEPQVAPKKTVVQGRRKSSRKSGCPLSIESGRPLRTIDERREYFFKEDGQSSGAASSGGLNLSPERLRSLIQAEEELKQRAAAKEAFSTTTELGKRKIAEVESDEAKKAASERANSDSDDDLDDSFDIIDSPTRRDMIQGDMDQMQLSRAALANIGDGERISWVEAKYEELIRGMRIYFNSQPDAIDLSSVLGIISLWNTKEEAFAKRSNRSQFTLDRHVPRFISGIYKAAEVLRQAEFPVDQKETIYKEFWQKFSEDVLDNPFYKILIGLRDEHKTRGWVHVQHEGINFTSISDINVVLTFCHQITHAVFNGVRLAGFSDRLMNGVLDRAHTDKAKRLAKAAKASSEKPYLPNLSINSSGDLARVVRQDFEALDELTGSIEGGSSTEVGLKLLRNLRGHLDLDFAPLRMTNFVHLLYSKNYLSASGENKRIDFFRFGSPTFTNRVGEISIEPMLLGLLDSYRETGKKHGYFNFQSSKEKSRMQGDESGRVNAIKGISEEYPENFLFFSFPMDSKAWKLEGSAKSARTVASLTAIIKEDFLNKGQPACFDYPDLIPGATEEENRAAAERFFDETAVEVYPLFAHNEELFQDHADMRKSYQFFIMLALHGKFYKHFGLDSANGACKDAIDRAGSFIVLCMYLEMLLDMFKKEGCIRAESIKEINEKVRLLANLFPFMVKGQAVVSCRRDHFLSTMDYIDRNLDPVINFMLRLFPDANSDLAAESKQEVVDIPAPPDLSVFV